MMLKQTILSKKRDSSPLDNHQNDNGQDRKGEHDVVVTDETGQPYLRLSNNQTFDPFQKRGEIQQQHSTSIPIALKEYHPHIEKQNSLSSSSYLQTGQNSTYNIFKNLDNMKHPAIKVSIGGRSGEVRGHVSSQSKTLLHNKQQTKMKGSPGTSLNLNRPQTSSVSHSSYNAHRLQMQPKLSSYNESSNEQLNLHRRYQSGKPSSEALGHFAAIGAVHETVYQTKQLKLVQEFDIQGIKKVPGYLERSNSATAEAQRNRRGGAGSKIFHRIDDIRIPLPKSQIEVRKDPFSLNIILNQQPEQTDQSRFQSQIKHKRINSASFAQKIYEVNQNGPVMVLTSKIASPGQFSNKVSANGSLGGATNYEQLSTDETEVRHQVQQIERGIQVRAMERYQMMQNYSKSKEDMLKVASQINDITFKYRIQNGGALVSNKSSQRYPIEVRVTKVQGLDVTPMISEKDRNINFENFQKIYQNPSTEKVRSNYPQLGSGNSYSHINKNPCIIHDQQKWEAFMKVDGRFNSKTRVSQTQPVSQNVSPSRVNEGGTPRQLVRKRSTTARHREAMLQQKMNEAKANIFNEDKDGHQSSIDKSTLASQPNSQHDRVAKREMQLNNEDKCQIQQQLQQDDRFIRNEVQFTRLQSVAQGRKLDSKKGLSDLLKCGFEKTSQQVIENSQFDPLRLKILIMPPQDANPSGKNADYYFLKGFKYGASEEFAHAMSSYLKGLVIKSDHLLCRFNLGVTLFKLGLFEEACAQYQTLQKQGNGNRPVVLYNQSLCELQAQNYSEAIETAKMCIALLLQKARGDPIVMLGHSSSNQQSSSAILPSHQIAALLSNVKDSNQKQGLNNSEVEMLADMHVVQGLSNLRSKNIKRAGKCFNEAKQYQVNRKTELQMLVEKYLSKMVHLRVMEYFRIKSKSQIVVGGNSGNENQGDLKNMTFGQRFNFNQSHVNKLTGAIMIRDYAAAASKQSRGRAASVLKTYLTDVDLDLRYQMTEALVQNSKRNSNLKRSKSQPIKIMKSLIQEVEELFKMAAGYKQRDTPSVAKQSVQEKIVAPQSLDDLSYPQLMEMFRSIVSQKADPEQCYFYIDDERTVRLDKLLNLPNSFEVKRSQITEKEKQEKLKREAIEMYYTAVIPPAIIEGGTNLTKEVKKLKRGKKVLQKLNHNSEQDLQSSLCDGREDESETVSEGSDTKHQNYLLENFFNLRDKLDVGQPDLKKSDQEAFTEFLTQIRKFNQKLDLSLNYFLNDERAAATQTKNSHKINQGSTAKLDSEIEQKIKEIKDRLDQDKIKKDEVVINKLRINEIETLEAEFTKKADRNVQKIENIVLILKAFKHLNPGLRQLVLQNAECRKFERNDVIYKQEEEGHHYYYMLRGSVSMLSKRADFGNFDLYIKSYYDGDCFGEQPQLFTKQGDTQQLASEDQLRQLSLRESTCIANDDCIVLQVSNSVKQEFYRTDSTNQYETSIYWLRKNQVFRMTEGFYLLQMIFNIERRVYKLGEALVRSGDTPEGMFIIISGQCKAVLESIGVKKIESGEYTRFEKQPKNFICGIPKNEKRAAMTEPGSPTMKILSMKERHESFKHKEESLGRFNDESSLFNSLKGDPKKTFQSTRIYLDDEGKHLTSHVAYQNNINYGNLVPGDSFGSRVLLPDEEISKRIKPDPQDVAKAAELISKKSVAGVVRQLTDPVFNQSSAGLFQIAVKNLKASALSIIADSKEVEVLILKTNILNYLPESEKDKIYIDIAKVCDPDKPNSITKIMDFKNEDRKWEGFRTRLVQDIRKSQYMERHRGVNK